MSLAEKDLKYIWHPYTHQKNMLPPIPIVEANGSLLFDAEGNEYIDAISSWWVNLHGHCHPYISQKVSELEKALTESGGLLKIVLPDETEKLISSKFMCPYDGFSFPEIELINYKNTKNSIGSKEKDKLIEFIKKPENFKRLEGEFLRREGIL